jgi:RHS repeat-associated protein
MIPIPRAGNHHAYAYDNARNQAAMTYGNGVAETRSFDHDYRLTGITDAGTSRLQNLAYAYYPTNNVQMLTDAVNSRNSRSFSYDSLQRLSHAVGSCAVGCYGNFGFTYDKDGNQLSQSLGATTTNYGYGTGSDQLATISVRGVATQAIGYTADGRMASLNPGIQTPAGKSITSLSYNQNAQLSAVNAGSGALASYTYDGFGQRMIKTVSASYGEIYQYSQNGALLEETNASGAAQADYIYLDGRPVATLNPSTGAPYFLHDDMLGTPQLATGSNQAVAWQASYQPFGQTSVSGTVTQNLRFPGQYFDVESGWNHNGFRNYVPALGRYVEPDPLGRLGSGNNLYAYVGDNPINFIDPFGQDVWLEGPSGNEPAGHLSINVGDPNGNYNSYSFGVNGDPWLGGEVYQDTSLGGEILPGYYLKTTTAQDAYVKALLDAELGKKAPYRPWRTCRSFSQGEFNRIRGLGIGSPAAPPSRSPAPGSKPWTVPSTSTTSAWDQLNAQTLIQNYINYMIEHF